MSGRGVPRRIEGCRGAVGEESDARWAATRTRSRVPGSQAGCRAAGRRELDGNRPGTVRTVLAGEQEINRRKKGKNWGWDSPDTMQMGRTVEEN